MSGTLLRLVSAGVFFAAALGGVACEDSDDLQTPKADAAADAPGGSPDSAGGNPDTAPGADAGPAQTFALTILHTNDLHSHLQGHYPEADYTPATAGDDTTLGGFARIAAAIRTHKTAALGAGRDVLLLDGGDFMMGTLFELAATQVAAELRLMQAVGYDAATMGNHELDWTPAGLAAILKAATTGEDKITFPVLASNVDFDPASPDDDALEQLKTAGVLPRKFIKTLPGGLTVGFFGLLGKQAQLFSPTAKPLTFAAIEIASQAMVNELRNTDHVDLVVALSHSGIGSDGQGEDRELAKMVPGIDIIISGHTHQKLEAPVVEGKTIIVTAGSYGEYLGRLDVAVTKQGGVVTTTVADYKLLPMNDDTAGDAVTQAKIDGLIAQLDASLPVKYRTPVAQTAADLTLSPFTESGLGELVTDSMLAAAQALDPDPSDVPVIAVEVNGQIRAPLLKGKTGKLWFADVFQVTPLGIGPDLQPGAPLVTYYLHGKDLRAGLEISAGADKLGDDVYTMQFSGLGADYNMNGDLLHRVTALRLLNPDGSKKADIDINDTTKCYKVVTSLQLAGLFDLVGKLTGGLLSVQGKLKDCMTPAKVLERVIDSDPVTAGMQELKEFKALLGYLAKLPDTDMDGIPNIPMSYAMPAGRIKLSQ
jgi:5'-nucleotidase/UDP-sugar diphosphatase